MRRNSDWTHQPPSTGGWLSGRSLLQSGAYALMASAARAHAAVARWFARGARRIYRRRVLPRLDVSARSRPCGVASPLGARPSSRGVLARAWMLRRLMVG